MNSTYFGNILRERKTSVKRVDISAAIIMDKLYFRLSIDVRDVDCLTGIIFLCYGALFWQPDPNWIWIWKVEKHWRYDGQYMYPKEYVSHYEHQNLIGRRKRIRKECKERQSAIKQLTKWNVSRFVQQKIVTTFSGNEQDSQTCKIVLELVWSTKEFLYCICIRYVQCVLR